MRKFKTFIAFLILVLIVFLLASCVSTEKLLLTKSNEEVVKIEVNRIKRKENYLPAYIIAFCIGYFTTIKE